MIELKSCKNFQRNPILLTKRLNSKKPSVVVEMTGGSTLFSCDTREELKKVERFLKERGIRKGSDFESRIIPRLHENDPITAYGFCTIKVSKDILEDLRKVYFVALWIDHWKWIIR